MKIIQMLTNLNWGDAIGNDVLAIDDILREAGYDTQIMALTICSELQHRAVKIDFSSVKEGDLVIFHKATGDGIMKKIGALPCKKVMIYHNVTPYQYFLPYDSVAAWNLWRGRRQVRKYTITMDEAWPVSGYNRDELRNAGMPDERLRVLPILYDIHAKPEEADKSTEEKIRSKSGTRLLFVGRITPNKKQEDIIKAYYIYQQNEDPDATLYLVGGWDTMDKYYAKLKGFCADLKLRDDQVVFTGRVSDAEKAAYLKNADALICMSEHEGFCVPLLEAARYDLPIIAYAASAVPETLGDNGLLFQDKDYERIAKAITRLKKDQGFRSRVVQTQHENLKRFDAEQTKQKLLTLTESILKGGEQT